MCIQSAADIHRHDRDLNYQENRSKRNDNPLQRILMRCHRISYARLRSSVVAVQRKFRRFQKFVAITKTKSYHASVEKDFHNDITVVVG